MTAQEIRDHYPNCINAISYCEVILDGKDPDDPESCFEILMSAIPPVELEEALDIIKEAVTDSDLPCPMSETALKEMDHPEFVTYLRAKLGAF